MSNCPPLAEFQRPTAPTPAKKKTRFVNVGCSCCSPDLHVEMSLAMKSAEFDGCRAAPYIDAHCHLEGVLMVVRTRQTVPSLNRQWSELTHDEKRLWRALGWSSKQWDGKPVENQIWKCKWSSLSTTEQASAHALGWDADKWDSYPPHWPWPESTDWYDLGEDVRHHLTVLGESYDSWLELFDKPYRVGAGEGGDYRTWAELSAIEKAAATDLGFSKSTWDADLTWEGFEMADVHAYVRDFCGSGFEACITQGCDDYSLPDAIKLALAHPKVFASFGCHPKNAWLYDEAVKNRLLEAFSTCGHKAVAWGEFGIDYSLHNWGNQPEYRRRQVEVFSRQLELAMERHLPLVLHVRNGEDDAAEKDALHTMQRCIPRDWKMHVHGNHCPNFARQVMAEWPNAYFGLTGTVTMGDEGEEMGLLVPIERLVLETDGPFLAPRGSKLNHVGQIPYIARCIAKLRGLDAEKVLAVARSNTRFVYGI
eukprot:TRINITY_DN44233_c0_g1_i1.p1 TRINITY_DN44233_c0_g1~~TRINITY_DN44233_c0_g1_i1.p1  ORF type:complete len:479 (+),score=42.46 TRINITY_DN44233_c0_g1_i1:216-1652(+)